MILRQARAALRVPKHFLGAAVAGPFYRPSNLTTIQLLDRNLTFAGIKACEGVLWLLGKPVDKPFESSGLANNVRRFS